MAHISSLRDLDVYRMAMDAAMRIFNVSKRFPAEERYSLTDQVRRSSRSVCANIAEAWRKRRYANHFVSKLSDAEAEAAETQVWLDFAVGCGYLDGSVASDLDVMYNHIQGKPVNMLTKPEQWAV
jgi:four helix bundle protein